jgi:hypothetical protein
VAGKDLVAVVGNVSLKTRKRAVAEKKKGKYVYYHCTGNAPNLTREKKCWTSALLTYSKVWSLTIKLWIGSLRLCIRATQMRSVSEKMRLLACKKNKARFKTGLIVYMTIGLTVLLSRISLLIRNMDHFPLLSIPYRSIMR